MTDRQLRALTRKHLYMIIRDLEKDRQQEIKEKEQMLIAYRSGLAQGQSPDRPALEQEAAFPEPERAPQGPEGQEAYPHRVEQRERYPLRRAEPWENAQAQRAEPREEPLPEPQEQHPRQYIGPQESASRQSPEPRERAPQRSWVASYANAEPQQSAAPSFDELLDEINDTLAKYSRLY